MHRLAPVALATLLAATAPAHLHAQTPTFSDPANLSGERVSPRTGRELPVDQGARGLQQLLRRLNTRASILNIVAHPDDEDGGMLTLYSRGLGARVADLSLTRGEGGQNAATGDFEDALGLLRTQELLSNDRYVGITQMFGTEVDFGFSKTKEEAFSKWTHDRVLYDAVRAIRIYRPLVITATFIGGVTDGHGQHQVSGEIAQEAFVAAGDPKVFPELTREGILPWQPLKVYARVPMAAISERGLFDYATGQYAPARFTNYVTGEVTTTPPSADVIVHEGTPDPLLTPLGANPSDLPPSLANDPNKPLTYVQFARIGLGLQRSQIGPGVRNAPSGTFDIAYHLYGSRLCPTPAPSTNVRHPERSAAEPKDPCIPPAAALPPGYSHDAQQSTVANGTPKNLSSRPAPELVEGGVERPPNFAPAQLLPTSYSPNEHQAPKARLIPAQGNALGKNENEPPRAESPISSNAGPTSFEDSQLERTLTNLSSRPKRSGVERPAVLLAVALPSEPSGHEPQSDTFFTGIDTTIEGIATLAPKAPASFRKNLAGLQTTIATATARFNPTMPAAIAPTLADALKQCDALIKTAEASSLTPESKANALHELRIKRTQLNDALTLSLGLQMGATAPERDIRYLDLPKVHLTVRSETDQKIAYLSDELQNPTDAVIPSPIHKRSAVLTKSSPHVDDLNIRLETSEGSRPYFYRDNIEQPVYKLHNRTLRNAPATPPALIAWVNLQYNGIDLRMGHVVESGNQPVDIVPYLNVTLSTRAQVLPLAEQTFLLQITDNSTSSHAGFDKLQLPTGWTAALTHSSSAPRVLTFTIRPGSLQSSQNVIKAAGHDFDVFSYAEGFRPIGYGDLPRTNYFTPATTRIVPVDLKLPTKTRIAYLPGTGDDVPSALASIGLTPTILTVADLTPAKLSQFDTVILGVRTYNAHPDLHGAPTQALLDFARAGGNVVVQYQTMEFTAADAPYPLSLGSNEKVVDETAPVELLQPTHRVFTMPNRVSTADFNGWIEERGHGFLSTWDAHYAALTETHDPGQSPQRGGLVTVDLGRGHWTYVAFALYRQLPEAVPGAYRLFTNLLALGDRK
jgi:LmbE family N-acetylglucosaminyl deacetylase